MVSRRDFLKTLGAGGAALYGLACGRSGSSGAAPSAVTAPILLLLDIDGGNDWLNMMPPTAGSNRSTYEQRRPTLGIPLAAVDDLGGIGLNRDFTGMNDLHGAGRVAWLPGIGMNNPNLSHFVSIALWGQGSAAPDGSGWLGRFADVAFDAGDVLRGLTVTPDLPQALKGDARTFVSITSATGYVYPSWLRAGLVGAPYDAALLHSGFSAATASASDDLPSQAGYAAAAAAGRLFDASLAQFGTGGSLPARTPAELYPGDAGYPVTRLNGQPLPSALANQLKLVARMIASGLPTQVYFARISGWDTHSNQAVDHPDLMRTLGGCLSAFHRDLAAIETPQGNAQDRVMVVGYSEFGRRVAENNGGTDHGTAGLCFALGNAVKGGFYGDYPDLSNLDGNGNMKYTVDFRSLYATVLERWLGLARATTDRLLGASYPRLGFL